MLGADIISCSNRYYSLWKAESFDSGGEMSLNPLDLVGLPLNLKKLIK